MRDAVGMDPAEATREACNLLQGAVRLLDHGRWPQAIELAGQATAIISRSLEEKELWLNAIREQIASHAACPADEPD